MREILFRGQIIDNNKWGYGKWVQGSLLINNNSYFISVPEKDSDGFYMYKVDPKTVGQYTGLKDKNGDKIFEGDTIQFKNIIRGVVKYSEEYAQFILTQTGEVTTECEPLGDFNTKDFEIVR